jgi:hypothetical protein
LLGARWIDYRESDATLTITGKVIRASGKGLLRIDETKTAAGRCRCRRLGDRSVGSAQSPVPR